ncbi:MAG TPA: 30S ribosomal protein S6 [Verrucomicrobiae bacterium]|nr:30S ribosomal protein S6 [Verrucomicrobiae bacterium]
MAIKEYEALFILDTRGKDEGVTDIIERIEAEIREAGGVVRGVQKMDRHRFERVSGKLDSGFFVNIQFSAPPDAIDKIRPKLAFDTEVFRQFYVNVKAAGRFAGGAKGAAPAE